MKIQKKKLGGGGLGGVGSGGGVGEVGSGGLVGGSGWM